MNPDFEPQPTETASHSKAIQSRTAGTFQRLGRIPERAITPDQLMVTTEPLSLSNGEIAPTGTLMVEIRTTDAETILVALEDVSKSTNAMKGFNYVPLESIINTGGPLSNISGQIEYTDNGLRVSFYKGEEVFPYQQAITELLRADQYSRLPEKLRDLSRTSHVVESNYKEEIIGIVVSSKEEIESILRLWGAGVTEASLIHHRELLAPHNPTLAQRIHAVLKPATPDDATDKIVRSIMEQFKEHKGREFSKWFDYDALSTAFFKTTVTIRQSNGCYLLSISNGTETLAQFTELPLARRLSESFLLTDVDGYVICDVAGVVKEIEGSTGSPVSHDPVRRSLQVSFEGKQFNIYYSSGGYGYDKVANCDGRIWYDCIKAISDKHDLAGKLSIEISSEGKQAAIETAAGHNSALKLKDIIHEAVLKAHNGSVTINQEEQVDFNWSPSRYRVVTEQAELGVYGLERISAIVRDEHLTDKVTALRERLRRAPLSPQRHELTLGKVLSNIEKDIREVQRWLKEQLDRLLLQQNLCIPRASNAYTTPGSELGRMLEGCAARCLNGFKSYGGYPLGMDYWKAHIDRSLRQIAPLQFEEPLEREAFEKLMQGVNPKSPSKLSDSELRNLYLSAKNGGEYKIYNREGKLMSDQDSRFGANRRMVELGLTNDQGIMSPTVIKIASNFIFLPDSGRVNLSCGFLIRPTAEQVKQLSSTLGSLGSAKLRMTEASHLEMTAFAGSKLAKLTAVNKALDRGEDLSPNDKTLAEAEMVEVLNRMSPEERSQFFVGLAELVKKSKESEGHARSLWQIAKSNSDWSLDAGLALFDVRERFDEHLIHEISKSLKAEALRLEEDISASSQDIDTDSKQWRLLFTYIVLGEFCPICSDETAQISTWAVKKMDEAIEKLGEPARRIRQHALALREAA